MARYYSKYAGPRLKEKLEELEAQTTDERLDLRQEVDMAMEQLEKAMIVYDKIVVDGTLDKKDEATGEVKPNIAAREMARRAYQDCREHVASLKEKAAKIEVLKKDKVSVHNLKWFSEQVIVAIVKYAEPVDPTLARRLTEEILKIRVLEQDASNPRVVLSIDV